MKGNRGTNRKQHWIEVFILFGDLAATTRIAFGNAEKLQIDSLDRESVH